ncbi:septal ring lytic transglycosylase RlpA family protein [Pinisolibacter aquiterrae]|uniref:septal ring lytic transglycosylase RlpA family protein n=1 Tax=Pinisolibacter aquiterrae TaxID=2815579 RepID=UPI001C3C7A1F|nr:septal ring lytic transglycosylase RlpA family protein [Pinisolibacter aquiterrae]MBV5265174.1 septal ring lytic transglycosylase RlpA family protein [Pinisolibacter aquiterrae]MCC8235496.1 septal ring lytic transglycosylase RlpA family protein [Pinisolibacter aquiterrae]
MTITRDDVASRRGGAVRSAFIASGLLLGGLSPVAAAEGVASFYGRSEHGGPTASGERFDMHAMTAAHRTARLGSHMRVTNLRNGRSVVVRINDRGPFVKGRIIDLSRAAADRLGFVSSGLTRVAIETVEAGAAETPTRTATADDVETTASIAPKVERKTAAAASRKTAREKAATEKAVAETAPKTAETTPKRDHAGEVAVALDDRDRYLIDRTRSRN